jgi:hypothetical protein
MNNYGLLLTFFPESGVICSDEKCGRPVQFLEKCFIDMQTQEVYCEPCGQCVRYERKMAEKRGER